MNEYNNLKTLFEKIDSVITVKTIINIIRVPIIILYNNFDLKENQLNFLNYASDSTPRAMCNIIGT